MSARWRIEILRVREARSCESHFREGRIVPGLPRQSYDCALSRIIAKHILNSLASLTVVTTSEGLGAGGGRGGAHICIQDKLN